MARNGWKVLDAEKGDYTLRLEYLRSAIEAEDISYGEIAELQTLAEHIDPTDVVLLEWAGVPEFPPTCDICGEPEDQDPANGGEYDWDGETGCHKSCIQGLTWTVGKS